MESAPISKNSISFGLALAIACIVNALIVVVKEKSTVVMDGMKKMTGHHWITHTIIVLAVFGILAWIFGSMNGRQGPTITGSRLINLLVSGCVAAGVIIIGFYLVVN